VDTPKQPKDILGKWVHIPGCHESRAVWDVHKRTWFDAPVLPCIGLVISYKEDLPFSGGGVIYEFEVYTHTVARQTFDNVNSVEWIGKTYDEALAWMDAQLESKQSLDEHQDRPG
jgi:hypothetical protein